MRFSLGVTLLFAAASALSAAEKDVKLLVPAYFYPADAGLKHWDALLKSSADVPIIVIVNPASGPGSKVDANYANVMKRMKNTKAIPIGYVSTKYGKRPLADVKADVNTWLRLYPGIQGIFFDEQASDAAKVDYYAKLYEYACKTKGLGLVVTNPGTTCDEKYLKHPAADTACVFENGKGFDKFRLPDWAADYAPNRFAVLSHDVGSAEQMRKQIKAAVEKKVGRVYVTNGSGANPWDGLPKYWDDEVALVRELNKKKHR